MKSMRGCLLLILAAASIFAADSSTSVTITGKLRIVGGKPAQIDIAGHKPVRLDGDEPTRLILADQRLDGYEVQAKGHYTSQGVFFIDPFHTKPLMVVKDGKLKRITYWCPTCHIRAYTPGPCVCCQAETELDLIDPDAE